MGMSGFRFELAELQRETKALKALGEDFLDTRTSWTLDRYSSNLQSIGRGRRGTPRTLDLQCLRTTPTTSYERGTKDGGKEIYANISGTWDLKPLENQKIEFCGIASTRIELYSLDEPGKRLAMWRLELGADDGPGCYIHAQILGDLDDSPFPKSVPIPRLPSIFITPMSAIEFALGELFQDKWAKVTGENTDEAKYWRALQRNRLQHLFSWYQSKLNNSGLSPWMSLKDWKPDDKLCWAK